MLKIAGAAATAATAHALLSAWSVGRGLLLAPLPRTPPAQEKPSAGGGHLPSQAETRSLVDGLLEIYACDRPHAVHSIVERVYSERGTFEDPAARCGSREEISEAFRALALVACVHRHSAGPPRVVGGGEEGTAVVEVPLAQSYALRSGDKVKDASAEGVRLDSTLILHLRSSPSEGWRIDRHEEWWGNRALLRVAAPSRRVNGALSYLLTSRLI